MHVFLHKLNQPNSLTNVLLCELLLHNARAMQLFCSSVYFVKSVLWIVSKWRLTDEVRHTKFSEHSTHKALLFLNIIPYLSVYHSWKFRSDPEHFIFFEHDTFLSSYEQFRTASNKYTGWRRATKYVRPVRRFKTCVWLLSSNHVQRPLVFEIELRVSIRVDIIEVVNSSQSINNFPQEYYNF